MALPLTLPVPLLAAFYMSECGRTNLHWADINEKPQKKRIEDDLMLNGQSSIKDRDRHAFARFWGIRANQRIYIREHSDLLAEEIWSEVIL